MRAVDSTYMQICSVFSPCMCKWKIVPTDSFVLESQATKMKFTSKLEFVLCTQPKKMWGIISVTRWNHSLQDPLSISYFATQIWHYLVSKDISYIHIARRVKPVTLSVLFILVCCILHLSWTYNNIIKCA